MCRNIKPLFNFQPTSTDEEIRDAAKQFVKKITAIQKPSEKNEIYLNTAVNEITDIIKDLFSNLEVKSKPKDKLEEDLKRKLRNEKRFGFKSTLN